ncbi:hypothetical protein [Microbacterium sp.]|uniref:hypothetical protein n=1 Tax=Microbacterium sp. TaxID=51671 RepID=UPI0026129FB2|nr:hypothetical protein [Microbacterium sp.]
MPRSLHFVGSVGAGASTLLRQWATNQTNVTWAPVGAVDGSRAADSPLVKIGAARVVVFDGQREKALRMLGSITADAPEERASLAALEAIVLRGLGRDADAALAARRVGTVANAYDLASEAAAVRHG